MFSHQILTAERDRIAKKIRRSNEIAQSGSFAVRDAVTFSGCIAAGKEDEVLSRANGITEEQRPDVLQVAIPKVKREIDTTSPAVEEMRIEKEEKERAIQEKLIREREMRESGRGISSRRAGGAASSSSISSAFDLSAFIVPKKQRAEIFQPQSDTVKKSTEKPKKGISESWTLDDITRIADDVEKKRAAECQSFAAYLVCKLNKELDDSVRVQIVAHKDKKGLGTHNYVLINFKGDDLCYEELEKQKDTMLIGDLWLLALGHDQVKDDGSYKKIFSNGIYTFNQYPVDHVMLKDLVEIYDNKKKPEVVAELK